MQDYTPSTELQKIQGKKSEFTPFLDSKLSIDHIKYIASAVICNLEKKDEKAFAPLTQIVTTHREDWHKHFTRLLTRALNVRDHYYLYEPGSDHRIQVYSVDTRGQLMELGTMHFYATHSNSKEIPIHAQAELKNLKNSFDKDSIPLKCEIKDSKLITGIYLSFKVICQNTSNEVYGFFHFKTGIKTIFDIFKQDVCAAETSFTAQLAAMILHPQSSSFFQNSQLLTNYQDVDIKDNEYDALMVRRQVQEMSLLLIRDFRQAKQKINKSYGFINQKEWYGYANFLIKSLDLIENSILILENPSKLAVNQAKDLLIFWKLIRMQHIIPSPDDLNVPSDAKIQTLGHILSSLKLPSPLLANYYYWEEEKTGALIQYPLPICQMIRKAGAENKDQIIISFKRGSKKFNSKLSYWTGTETAIKPSSQSWRVKVETLLSKSGPCSNLADLLTTNIAEIKEETKYCWPLISNIIEIFTEKNQKISYFSLFYPYLAKEVWAAFYAYRIITQRKYPDHFTQQLAYFEPSSNEEADEIKRSGFWREARQVRLSINPADFLNRETKHTMIIPVLVVILSKESKAAGITVIHPVQVYPIGLIKTTQFTPEEIDELTERSECLIDYGLRPVSCICDIYDKSKIGILTESVKAKCVLDFPGIIADDFKEEKEKIEAWLLLAKRQALSRPAHPAIDKVTHLDQNPPISWQQRQLRLMRLAWGESKRVKIQTYDDPELFSYVAPNYVAELLKLIEMVTPLLPDVASMTAKELVLIFELWSSAKLDLEYEEYFGKLEAKFAGLERPKRAAPTSFTSYNLHAILPPLEDDFKKTIEDFYENLYAGMKCRVSLEPPVSAANDSAISKESKYSLISEKISEIGDWKVIKTNLEQEFKSPLPRLCHFGLKIYDTDSKGLMGLLSQARKKLNESTVPLDYDIGEQGIYDECAVILFEAIQAASPVHSPIILGWFIATLEKALQIIEEGFSIALRPSKDTAMGSEIHLAKSPEQAMSTITGEEKSILFAVQAIPHQTQSSDVIITRDGQYIPLAFFSLSRRKLQGESLFTEASSTDSSTKLAVFR